MPHHHASASKQTPPHRHRFGSCLEHGSAHSLDHQQWTRRDFMAQMSMAAMGVAFSINGRTASAYGRVPLLNALAARQTDRILILIQMNGGNDGLNMVVPVNNDIYYRSRPTIAIPKNQAFLLDSETGLHPAMQGLMDLWSDNRMAVIHNTGYPNSTRSHFEGTVNWSTARDQNANESSGWLGRYLADAFFESDFEPKDFPLAVRVGGPATLFQSEYGNLSVTFGDASQFQRFVNQGGFYDADGVPETVYGEALSYVRQVTNASFRYVESVQNAAENGSNLIEYPNTGFAGNLSVIARMLRGGLETPMYTVSHGGFDTHSDQGSTIGGHANNLRNIGDGVAAFLADLAEDGLDDRVMVMTFSEFGRTLQENGSGGTDHGAGAPMMLFGKGLNGGLYGQQSDLLDLYGGDPLYTTDYRSAYATLLEDWFGMSSSDVDSLLGRSFERLGFVGDKLAVHTEASEIPTSTGLAQNYPNPFQTTTEIAFTLSAPVPVVLEVYDLQGRRVKTLAQGTHPAGQHRVTFDGGQLPSGTYLYRIQTPYGTETQQMVLVR